MIISLIPALITEMTSLLTRKQCKYATIYADQTSRLGYVYLEADTTVETILKGKLAYECFVLLYGINIRRYHANNGILRLNIR